MQPQPTQPIIQDSTFNQFLKQVNTRQEAVVVEGIDQMKAVLVPIQEYQDIQQKKREARTQFWAMTKQFQQQLKNVNPQELQREIETGLEEARVKRPA